uniref:Uncharacterized protein n=1 Tax=Arundo donax TaxID=35708 RepID=A0A0A9DEM6_ARUDO
MILNDGTKYEDILTLVFYSLKPFMPDQYTKEANISLQTLIFFLKKIIVHTKMKQWLHSISIQK